jgi:hypothetical protein
MVYSIAQRDKVFNCIAMEFQHPFDFDEGPDWSPNQKLVRAGFQDLKYLPRSGWNATLAAHAYAARQQLSRFADLNLWAAMHNAPASARYEELAEDALVLWHGTSAARAEKISQFGLFHKRGLWTASEPRIAHGYTRERSGAYRAGSATVVLVLDRTTVEEGVHYHHDSPEIFRFHSGIPREAIEYILWDDRVEFVGAQQAKLPKRWGVARFKKVEGQWYLRSQPPVRFDNEHTYDDKEGWLRLSIQRIISTLQSALAVEVFSSLYATIAPWEVLTHEDIFSALEDVCSASRRRGRYQWFSLPDV